MPESVTDRPTKAHEQIFLLTKSPRYFFDQEAVREASLDSGGNGSFAGRQGGTRNSVVSGGFGDPETHPYGNGRNIRSVWEIATEPYPEAHFATFPQALVEPCIKAGTSERGCCPECGAPWVRKVERELEATRGKVGEHKGEGRADPQDAGSQWNHSGGVYGRYRTETTGWKPSCEHYAYEIENQTAETRGSTPCVVLDPFLGSGTTALVARRLGRKCIGIELNQEYAELAARRLQQLSLLAEGAA